MDSLRGRNRPCLGLVRSWSRRLRRFGKRFKASVRSPLSVGVRNGGSLGRFEKGVFARVPGESDPAVVRGANSVGAAAGAKAVRRANDVGELSPSVVRMNDSKDGLGPMMESSVALRPAASVEVFPFAVR